MTTENLLLEALKQAIDKETAKIVEEEAEAAAVRVWERVRGMVGQIATKLATDIQFDRLGTDLRILVKIQDSEETRILRSDNPLLPDFHA